MLSFEIQNKFKGNRNYVHGTDLFNLTIDELRKKGFDNISNFELKFVKPTITSNSRAFLYLKEDLLIKTDIDRNYNVTVKFSYKNQNYIILFYEGVCDNKLERDESFEEAKLFEHIFIEIDKDNHLIKFSNFNANISQIECCVFGAKKMFVGVNLRLIYAHFEYIYRNNDIKNIEIEHNNPKNDNLFVFKIKINGESSGILKAVKNG